MKVTKQLKFLMQLNNFVGMAAAVFLIKMGVNTTFAWSGFAVNALCFLYWIFVKETPDEPKQ